MGQTLGPSHKKEKTPKTDNLNTKVDNNSDIPRPKLNENKNAQNI
jgi:hypothetical protein